MNQLPLATYSEQQHDQLSDFSFDPRTAAGIHQLQMQMQMQNQNPHNSNLLPMQNPAMAQNQNMSAFSTMQNPSIAQNSGMQKSGMNPTMMHNSGMTQGMNPAMNPAMNQTTNPAMNPAFNLAIYQAMNQAMNQPMQNSGMQNSGINQSMMQNTNMNHNPGPMQNAQYPGTFQSNGLPPLLQSKSYFERFNRKRPYTGPDIRDRHSYSTSDIDRESIYIEEIGSLKKNLDTMAARLTLMEDAIANIKAQQEHLQEKTDSQLDEMSKLSDNFRERQAALDKLLQEVQVSRVIDQNPF